MSFETATHDHDSLITLSAASALSGYSIDYLSRLCKAKKIECLKGDRGWMVYANAFRLFLQDTEERKRLRAQKLSEERREQYEKTRALEEIATENIVIPEITPVTEEKQKASPQFLTHYSSVRRALSLGASTFAAVAFVTSVWFGVMENGGLQNMRQFAVAYEALSPLESTALNWYHFVNRNLAWIWGGERKSYIAIETTSPDTSVPITTTAPTDVPAKPFQGAVVVPRDPSVSAERQARAITNTFSDEVRVQPLADGTGIITPVFKTATSQEYLYVMVPMATSSP